MQRVEAFQERRRHHLRLLEDAVEAHMFCIRDGSAKAPPVLSVPKLYSEHLLDTGNSRLWHVRLGAGHYMLKVSHAH